MHPNTFKEFVDELVEDDASLMVNSADVGAVLNKLLEGWREDFKRGTLLEVLELDSSQPEIDTIEAAFRTAMLDLFPGPSYVAKRICGKHIPELNRQCLLPRNHEPPCGSHYED